MARIAKTSMIKPDREEGARGNLSKRTAEQHEFDLEYTAKMYLRGLTYSQIATELEKRSGVKVSKQQIYLDVQKIRKMWLDNATQSYEMAIARELAKIDSLESAYWDAYDKVMSGQVIELEEKVNSLKDNVNRALTKRTTNIPNVDGILKGIQWCIEKRLQLLGKNEVIEHSITWENDAMNNGVGNPKELFENLVTRLMDEMANTNGASGSARGTTQAIIDGTVKEIPAIPAESSRVLSDGSG